VWASKIAVLWTVQRSSTHSAPVTCFSPVPPSTIRNSGFGSPGYRDHRWRYAKLRWLAAHVLDGQQDLLVVLATPSTTRSTIALALRSSLARTKVALRTRRVPGFDQTFTGDRLVVERTLLHRIPIDVGFDGRPSAVPLLRSCDGCRQTFGLNPQRLHITAMHLGECLSDQR
jgi:hypothetical protein